MGDFRELIAALEQHPEWRAELRRLLLTDDLLTLPETVSQLVQAQQRTDEQIRQLTEAQRQTTQQIQQFTEQVSQFGIRVEELSTVVNSLAQSLQKIGDDVAKLKEFFLEDRYHSRAAMYFSKLIRRTRAIDHDDLCQLLDDAQDQGILTDQEREDLVQTDVVVRGRRRTDGEEVYLIVEVSWGIGVSDVQRASRRARTFTKLGWQTMPVVAGGWLSADARQAAQQEGVVAILDGARAVLVE